MLRALSSHYFELQFNRSPIFFFYYPIEFLVEKKINNLFSYWNARSSQAAEAIYIGFRRSSTFSRTWYNNNNKKSDEKLIGSFALACIGRIRLQCVSNWWDEGKEAFYISFDNNIASQSIIGSW